MIICFATEYYPPFAPGGAEWSNAALAHALGRRGHRVVVVTPNYGAAPMEEESGVTVHRVPFPVKLRSGQAEVAWLAHRNPLFYLYFAWYIWWIGRAAGAAVIHAQNKGALLSAWLAARLLRRPVFVTLRDVGLLCPLGMCPLFESWKTFDCTFGQYVRRCAPYFLEHYHPKEPGARRFRRWAALTYGWLDQRLRQWALRRVDGVIGVSQGILGIYPERLLGRAQVRVVHTLPPSAEPLSPAEVMRVRDRFRLGDGPLVLYAGKLSLGKGTSVFLEALDLIRAKVPGVRFALAGKGEWPVQEREDVHRLGVLRQEELFGLYAAADVVVVPSIWPEPLSRVILEAMGLGRPVVATAVGGSPEVVEDDVTGLLVPRGDAVVLARAISELLLDEERRRRMGEAAQRRAATVFEERRLVTALLDAYHNGRGGIVRAGLAYYLGVSYRRKRVDSDLHSNSRYLSGRVLDVGGGRRRGVFRPPASARWVIVDIRPGQGADVTADVQALPFRDGVFDAVKATEVFEHVRDVTTALGECSRVLRAGGHLVATVPFLERLHSDPNDYSRFSRAKWEDVLAIAGLTPVTITEQGGYFTHLAGLLRFLVLRAPAGLRHAGYFLFPLLDMVARLDGLRRVRQSDFAAFVGGYLIIATR